MKTTIGKILFWVILVVCGFVGVNITEHSPLWDNHIIVFLTYIQSFLLGVIGCGLILGCLFLLGQIAEWLFNSAFHTKDKENPIDK